MCRETYHLCPRCFALSISRPSCNIWSPQDSTGTAHETTCMLWTTGKYANNPICARCCEKEIMWSSYMQRQILQQGEIERIRKERKVVVQPKPATVKDAFSVSSSPRAVDVQEVGVQQEDQVVGSDSRSWSGSTDSSSSTGSWDSADTESTDPSSVDENDMPAFTGIPSSVAETSGQ